jgi:hypothetical protein
MVGRPTEEDEEVFELEPDLADDNVPLRLEHDDINIMHIIIP